jgi:hypothetical protein
MRRIFRTQDHGAAQDRSACDSADESGRLNCPALHHSRDAYRLATIAPGQHPVVRACAMLDFPTSRKLLESMNSARGDLSGSGSTSSID